MRKPVYANNKGADQPAHRRSLISAFVVRCLECITESYSLFWGMLADIHGLTSVWT